MDQVIDNLNLERQKFLKALLIINKPHNKKTLLNFISDIDETINKLNSYKNFNNNEMIKNILIQENINLDF